MDPKVVKAFIRKMHAEGDYKSNVSILKDWNSGFQSIGDNHMLSDRLYPVKASRKKNNFLHAALKEIEQESEECYFSINSFLHKKRCTENVWHLNSFVIDYDFYKMKEYQHLTPSEMYMQHIKDSLRLPPTAVIDSGRGLYVIYKFRKNTRIRIDFYKSLYTALIKSQEQYGADSQAGLVTQVIRLPGTFNSNAMRHVGLLEFDPCTHYEIEDFTYCLPYSREDVQLHKKKHNASIPEKKKDIDLKKKFRKRQAFAETKAGRIINDFKALIKLRNHIDHSVGYREQLIYIARNALKATGFTYEEEMMHAYELNNRFVHPLSKKEVQNQCKPTCAQNIHTIAKIIERLQITGIEQQHLVTLSSEAVKKERYLKKIAYERHHKILGMTDDDINKKKRRTYVLALRKQGKRNAEIANVLSVAKSTIANDIAYIESHLYQFIEDLRTVLTRLEELMSDVSFTRKLVFKEQKQLSEWQQMIVVLLE